MPEEHRFGIRVIRQGCKYSVYTRARRYVKSHLSEFDVIVDEINTVPFWVPRIAKDKPVVALIHQLAKEIWFYETKFPLNYMGYAIEPLWLRKYKRVPTVTVSESTKRDLLELGFNQVRIVSNGIGVSPSPGIPSKESHPVFAFVGRLVKCKLPQHAILAFANVKVHFPNAELWIIGDGYLRPTLEKSRIEGVKFFGKISEQAKFDLLRRAHILLMPSVREGWGISVIEANAVGTPAVGYAVPGLQDSIVDGLTGRLVRPLDYAALADAAEQTLLDTLADKNLSNNALEWSRKFSWDASAREFLAFLESVM